MALVVLSVAAFFIMPGAADDLDAVSQTTRVQLIAVEKTPVVRSPTISRAAKARISSKQYLSQRETPDLLNLICVRLC